MVLYQEGVSGKSWLAASSLPGVALKQCWKKPALGSLKENPAGRVVLRGGPVARCHGALVTVGHHSRLCALCS